MSLRFGLVGTGYWADTVHAAGLASHPDVELVGVWGRDVAKAAAIAERHATAAEVDLDVLLDQVDAVAIAVPPDVQGELACRAAKAGRHLLLEKPLALSVAAADRVVAATERAGVASLVFFTMRFGAPTAEWFRSVIGPAEWHGGSVTLLASLLSSRNPMAQSAWRQQYGALWDAGPHAVAALLAALGPVEEVVAERGPGGAVHLVLRHEAGGASSATVTLTAPDAATRGSVAQVAAAQQDTMVPPPAAHIRVEFWGPEGLVGPPAPHASRSSSPAADAYASAISELLSAVETGRAHACDVRFAADVVRVLAAAERFLDRPSERRGERP